MAKAKANRSTGSAGVMAKEDMSWRARDDLSTLTRAQEIAADKSRLSAAKREATKQQSSLSRITKLSGKRI